MHPYKKAITRVKNKIISNYNHLWGTTKFIINFDEEASYFFPRGGRKIALKGEIWIKVIIASLKRDNFPFRNDKKNYENQIINKEVMNF